MIKFLKDQSTDVKEIVTHDGVDIEISFAVRTITTSEQARLIDKAKQIKDGESKVEYFKEQVRFIDDGKVKIGDDTISAQMLAEKGKLTHDLTGKVVTAISRGIDKVVFLDDDEIKK